MRLSALSTPTCSNTPESSVRPPPSFLTSSPTDPRPCRLHRRISHLDVDRGRERHSRHRLPRSSQQHHLPRHSSNNPSQRPRRLGVRIRQAPGRHHCRRARGPGRERPARCLGRAEQHHRHPRPDLSAQRPHSARQLAVGTPAQSRDCGQQLACACAAVG